MSEATEVLSRIEGRDASLWPAGNVASTRLGWIEVFEEMRKEARPLRRWADAQERSRVILIGMGGSALAPEVLRSARRASDMVVLDTTSPASIASVDPTGALFVVSSKSGTTLEVRCLLDYFWERVPDGSRYVAITDPGTPLAKEAAARGFARVFEARPDIGGRYSALSYFGLVPAALCGYDVGALCEAAGSINRLDAVQLGLDMGHAAHSEHRDKVTVVVPPGPFTPFGSWVEQLLAESTGKSGTGLVPVPTTSVEEGVDRFIEAVHLGDPVELGAEFLRWELATAAAGHVLGVDPFDEPDVAAAKANTARLLDSLPLPDVPVAEPAAVGPWLEDQVGVDDYIAIQAFLPLGSRGLEELRRRLRDRFDGMAVTAGFGPRYLHSTGQLHKGGPPAVVAVQVVEAGAPPVVEIPGMPYDFATLIRAQAIGDFQALQARGARVLRVATDSLERI